MATKRCDGCGTTGDDFLRCGVCLSAFYCSRKCQVAAWKQGHKAVCKKPLFHDFGRLDQRISPAACEQLLDQGFMVIDNFLGHDWATALRSEIQFLREKDLLVPNKTQFPSTTTPGAVTQYDKPNIYEADLHNTAVRTQVPQLDALFHQDDLARVLASHTGLPLVHRTQGKTLKVQFNAGHGGCFPCHYDNPGRPNKRRLTCLIYFNPDWKDGDGGEIELYPFLSGTSVVVRPLMDRLVVFSSDRILHRVLPSQAERYCLTVWIDGENVNTDADSQLNIAASDLNENWDGFIAKLAKSPVQRLVSRGVYAEEYLESLTQCMEQGAPQGFADMLHSHETHLARLQLNTPLQALIDRLRAERAKRVEIATPAHPV
ncbi:unnamed protein product [Aphanomyces euteiches]|nr:hypothetical protein AeRB84_004724 [Aphanomyces euteiches]